MQTKFPLVERTAPPPPLPPQKKIAPHVHSVRNSSTRLLFGASLVNPLTCGETEVAYYDAVCCEGPVSKM